MQSFALTGKTKNLLWWSLGFALLAHVFFNAVVPLTDSSEARYGEIARKMLETGDWITPQHDYGVPFWAKPPLSTWLAALSMKIFGVNEFAARLPSILLGIGLIALVWHWAQARRNRDFALAVSAALASMSLFFITSSAVMTDESLVFCTTLTMIAFWRALNADDNNRSQRRWGYLFFAGLGLGLLAKGLLAGVLTFLPILPWIILRRNWRQVWRALPWVRGSVLMLAISLPWYLVAEHKTPGFLAYFILGEHFGRFLNAGWSGDKYGNAHAETFGMIWTFWLIAALPWSFIFIARLKQMWRTQRKPAATSDGWLSYLLLWSFMPVVFFTFAHNIIWTYPLPALPAFAVLAIELLARDSATQPFNMRLAAANFITPAIMVIVAAMYVSGHHDLLKASQKYSVDYFLQSRPSPDSELYFFRHRYYSGEFYSDGKSRMIDQDHITTLFNNHHTDFLIIHEHDLQHLSPEQRQHFVSVKDFGDFTMLKEIEPNIASTHSHP